MVTTTAYTSGVSCAAISELVLQAGDKCDKTMRQLHGLFNIAQCLRDISELLLDVSRLQYDVARLLQGSRRAFCNNIIAHMTVM